MEITLSPGTSVMPDWNGRGEVLMVDKPLDWTSFDVVKKVRSLFRIRKLGHAGTLDPRATGLLILCSGPRTKDIGGFADLDKTYEGALRLGVVSPSYDEETEIIPQGDPSGISREALNGAVERMRGTSSQVPPMYSAVKYAGKPLYAYARAGRVVDRSPKEISVFEFQITRYENPEADFRVRCTKGTYVRSLVHDLGQVLGCGAVLKNLRRTAIGPFNVGSAFRLDALVALRNRLQENTSSHASRTTAA